MTRRYHEVIVVTEKLLRIINSYDGEFYKVDTVMKKSLVIEALF